MKNIPEQIYLQIGEECESNDFNELHEVTWAADWINENDILYFRHISSDAVLSEVMTKIEEISFINDRTDLLVANIDEIEKILSHYFR